MRSVSIAELQVS